MSNKHKAKRKILNKSDDVMKNDFGTYRVKQVVWCIVQEENSKSIYTDHIGITTYVDGVKNQGIAAWMSKKPMRLSKKDPDLEFLKHMRNDSFTEAFYNSLRGTRTGKVRYFNESSGEGAIRDSATGITVAAYACNIKGANNAHPHLVTNKTLKEGDNVIFTLGDYHTTKACGACDIGVAHE